jgi:hypothetical protein
VKRLTPLTWIVLFICGLALFTTGVRGLAEAYSRAVVQQQSQVCAAAVDRVMHDNPGFTGIILCVPR